jgi:hypothetical protein
MALALGGLGYMASALDPRNPTSQSVGRFISRDLGPLTEIILIFLAASVSHRPRRYEVAELQHSKVVTPEELTLGRWLAMEAIVFIPVLLMYAGAMAGQLMASSEPIVALAYLQSFARFLPTVLLFSTLAFYTVTSMRTLVTGAGLTGILWVAYKFAPSTLAGYPGILQFNLGQNRYITFGLAATLLCFMLAHHEGRRRAKHALTSRILGTLTAVLLTATLVHGGWVALALPGQNEAYAKWKRLEGYTPLQSSGSKDNDPMPNFAWLDLKHERVSVEMFRGRPALLLFFQPDDRSAVYMLQNMAQYREQKSEERLGILAICMSEDLSSAGEIVRLASAKSPITYPVVTDWGRPGRDFDEGHPGSVISWAYQPDRTPSIILLDAEGVRVGSLRLQEGADIGAVVKPLLDRLNPEPG